MKWFHKPQGNATSPQENSSPPALSSSLRERECHRALELGHPLTLLRLELANGADIFQALEPERIEQTREELELILRGTLRTTDILQTEDANGFTILLPGTTALDAPTVVHNVRQAMQGYHILLPEKTPSYMRLRVWIAFASLPEDGIAAQVLITMLEERLAQQRLLPPAPPDDESSSRQPFLRLIA